MSLNRKAKPSNRRRDRRATTICYEIRVWDAATNLSFMMSGSLIDQSRSGAQVELETEPLPDHLVVWPVSSRVWLEIPAHEAWHEAIVRWFSGRCLGLSFVGQPRNRPPAGTSRLSKQN